MTHKYLTDTVLFILTLLANLLKQMKLRKDQEGRHEATVSFIFLNQCFQDFQTWKCQTGPRYFFTGSGGAHSSGDEFNLSNVCTVSGILGMLIQVNGAGQLCQYDFVLK